MSRIANSPVSVPEGVEITLNDKELSVKGSKGNLSLTIHELVELKHEDGQMKLAATKSSKQSGALAGTFRALVSNMVTGVTTGYSKKIMIVGVGYKVAAKGKDLEFALGYSHPVPFAAPAGITFTVESPTDLVVSGVDKQLVGEVVAKIQKLRKADPYKGKGLHLQGQRIRRKAGKTGKKA